MKNRRLVLAIALVLATANPGRADVGVIVLEPINTLGFFTRVGHAGTYLSDICPDGSPVKMRLCRPDELGGVVSRYAPFSDNEDYDWAIVPLEAYLNGVESADIAPMIATRNLQRAIERYNFGPLFSHAVTTAAGGKLPDGQWKAALATRFDRNIYIFTVDTTAADDAAIVKAFNTAPNKSRFNFFYRNCSNQAKSILDLVLPHPIGDRWTGLTMETPKGLAKALVDRALAQPGVQVRVRRYPQVPGTFPRSRDVLFPMENTYQSMGFAPWWIFGGYREVALGAMLYHEVIAPFEMFETYRDFLSPRAAQFTLEQYHLRAQQDEVRGALALALGRGTSWSRLATLNESVSRRLDAIRRGKQAEATRILGSKAQWRARDAEFQARFRAVDWTRFIPDALRQPLAQVQPNGHLSEQLLQHFEAEGEFSIDERGPGPWISLPLNDGKQHATGVSRSQILAGDPRVAALVLAAVIDYDLNQPEARRVDLAHVDGLLAQLGRAIDRIELDANASREQTP